MTHLYLHGFTGDATTFDAVRSRIEGPALCPTLLGHGPPPWADSWEAEIDRLASEVRQRADGPVVAVGYSLGARVTAGLVARHPDLVAHAYLVGAHLGLDDADRPGRQAWEDGLARDLRRDGVEAFVDRWERLPLWASQADLPAETLARQRATRTAHTAEGLARSLEVLGTGRMPDLRPAIAASDVPVTLIVGSLDTKFMGLSEDWQRLPAVTRRVVPGVGHNVVLEAPAAVASIVA